MGKGIELAMDCIAAFQKLVATRNEEIKTLEELVIKFQHELVDKNKEIRKLEDRLSTSHAERCERE